MTLYVVQVAGTHAAALDKARFVKDGFSKPAFLFAQFWLLYHRLWVPFVVWMIAEVAVFAMVAPHLPGIALLALDLVARFYLGFEGNRLRLERRAALTELVDARDLDEAEAIFFRRQIESRNNDTRDVDARSVNRAGLRA